MEIWVPNGLQPAYNMTQRRSPIFLLDRIDPAIEYEIRLFSVNQKGRSEPVIMRISPSKEVAMYASKFQHIYYTYTYYAYYHENFHPLLTLILMTDLLYPAKKKYHSLGHLR